MLRDLEFSSDTLIDAQVLTPSSPTLSVSTISDLTPSELGAEGIGAEHMLTHHKSFYLEDGNVEIVCGHTIFRIHSSIVSSSSPRLRDMLSPSALLNAPTPGGCPRISSSDSAEDFAVLLKMVITPGYISLTVATEPVELTFHLSPDSQNGTRFQSSRSLRRSFEFPRSTTSPASASSSFTVLRVLILQSGKRTRMQAFLARTSLDHPNHIPTWC